MDVSLMDQSDGRPRGIQEEQPAPVRGAMGLQSAPSLCCGGFLVLGLWWQQDVLKLNTGLLAVVFTF